MMIDKLRLRNLVNNPGVYIFKDSNDSIIYIGKAKNLKKRINQYFSSKHENSIKTQFLVKNIFDFEFIVVDNEVEALLLENKLIKKNKPKYNINLKDSKTYPYIKITDERLPKIQFTRIVTNKGIYFGPFADGGARREIFDLTVRLFKLITKQTYSSKSQINYEIGLAPAKDLKSVDRDKYVQQVKGAIEFLKGNNSKILSQLKREMKTASENMKFEIALEKKKQIEAIKFFREKQKVDLIKNFDQDIVVKIEDELKNNSMIQVLKIKKGVISSKKNFNFNYVDEFLVEDFIKMYYSKNSIPKEILVQEEFWKDIGQDEESLSKKNLIEKYLSKLRNGKVSILIPKRGEKLSLIKLALKNAKLNQISKSVLVELKEKLGLRRIPRVIECFDMSNLGSDYLVGGMVQFKDGVESKDNYRKFEIKSFSGRNDDFAAMKEVIFRRYLRLKNDGFEMPDLILVDGGKGQLKMGVEALKEVGVKIPIISLAKKDEEIFILGKKDSFKFDKMSPIMLFLRNVRDSAHNYVINYNRKKREMRLREEFG